MMDSTWATIVIWCLLAGPGLGFVLGYWWRGKRDRRNRRVMAHRRVSRRKQVAQRQADEETVRIAKLRRVTHDAGRKLPPVEGAGPPIKVRRMRISRSPKPQI